MKNDNLTVRERLIDFFDWYQLNHWLNDETHFVIDEYLEDKSINQSSNEALTLDTIEQKEKICLMKETKINF